MAAAGFAVIAGVLSLFGRRAGAGESLTALRVMTEPPDRSRADDEPVDSPDPQPSAGWLWTGWGRAISSPLVRAIAMSTAAMVLVRYGLSMVSIDQVSTAFADDEDRVAGFLGKFGVMANAAGALLGVLVVPRLLQRFGVGLANLAYAVITVAAYGGLLMVPGLLSAVLARFVNVQFKDALKTPLSTLFYGAEPPHRRALARALVFGAVIPAATVLTAMIFELAPSLWGVAWIGLGAALLFTIACALQNRRWRARMAELLAWKLCRTPAPETAALDRARQALAAYRAGDAPGDAPGETIDRIALGLASPDPRTRAVAEEVLAETIPRRRAHDIAGDIAGRAASGRDGDVSG
jgi:hypothetical protein